MMLRKVLWCALACSVSGAVWAQEVPSSPREVIATALAQNLDLEVSRLEIGKNEDQLTVAWGAFRPVFSLSYSVEKSSLAQNEREFLGTAQAARIFEEDRRAYEVGVGGRLPFGTEYQVFTRAAYLDNTLNRRPIALFGPEYQTSSGITITQPLLRNFGFASNLAEIRLQRSAILTSELRAQAAIEQVAGQTLTALYENAFAVENIRVKEEAITLAETLLADNQRRVDNGVMSPIDVTQAKVRVAEAKEELIHAQNFYAVRQNTLRELLGGEIDFNASAIAVTSLDGLIEAPELNRAALAAELLQSSPLYKSALEKVNAEEVRVAYARNQGFPQVDLKGSFGYNGLNDELDTAYRDYENRDEPDWSVGVVVSIPLERKISRARVSQAQRAKRQALFEVKKSENQLLLALDNAVRDLESARQRRELVGESVRLAREALDAEERRLTQGVTTSYDVLNQQRELSFALTRELAAQVDVNKAVVQLYLVQGVLTRKLGFALEFNSASDK